MRLIDTKKFAIISKYHIPEIIEDTWEEGYYECLKVLDMTPTVEAIPIEWLRKYFAKVQEEIEMYCQDIDGNDIPRILEYAIKDWRKENEAN